MALSTNPTPDTSTDSRVPALLTGPQVIALLAITRSTFSRWVKVGPLSQLGTKVGRQWYFSGQSIAALLPPGAAERFFTTKGGN